jgi:hypothetical protein
MLQVVHHKTPRVVLRYVWAGNGPLNHISSLFYDQYCLPPNSVVYAGSVGEDELAEQLKAANKREGLAEVYQVKKGEKTGACAVLITGHHR